MSRGVHKWSGRSGQVALEYALATMVVAGVASLLWIFHQGFVQGTLYGGGEGNLNSVRGVAAANQAMGFERTVSLPFP
jgi:hypothetical protein